MREKEDEVFINQQIEADMMYHAYEIEKNKKRQEQMEFVTKKNKKLIVRIYSSSVLIFLI